MTDITETMKLMNLTFLLLRCRVSGNASRKNKQSSSHCLPWVSNYRPSSNQATCIPRKVSGNDWPDIAQTSSNSGTMLNSFPTEWQSHIQQASQQWKRYLVLVQPFEPTIIQLDKVKHFIDKMLAIQMEEGPGLRHGKTASYFTIKVLG